MAPAVDVAAVVVAVVAVHTAAPLPARSFHPHCGTTVDARAGASWEECLVGGYGYRIDRNPAWGLACQSSLILET